MCAQVGPFTFYGSVAFFAVVLCISCGFWGCCCARAKRKADDDKTPVETSFLGTGKLGADGTSLRADVLLEMCDVQKPGI